MPLDELMGRTFPEIAATVAYSGRIVLDETPEEWLERRLQGPSRPGRRHDPADQHRRMPIWCATAPAPMAAASWSSPMSPTRSAPKPRWPNSSTPWPTAEAQAEKQSTYLADLTQRLDQASAKVDSAKTTLLRTMGHELKTPLNAILGFSDLMATLADNLSPDTDPRICRAGASGRHQPAQDDQPDHGPDQDFGRPL